MLIRAALDMFYAIPIMFLYVFEDKLHCGLAVVALFESIIFSPNVLPLLLLIIVEELILPATRNTYIKQ